MMEQQLLQEEKKPNLLAFQIAVIYAFYSMALTYVSESMGISGADPESTSVGVKALITLLTYVPFVAAILYVQIKHRTELGGRITFGRAFSAGFKMAAYAGLFVGLLTILYYKVISPGSLDKIMDAAIEKADGNEAQLEGMEMMSQYMAPMMAFGIAVTFTLLGLIISLITAAIVKKENNTPFAEPMS